MYINAKRVFAVLFFYVCVAAPVTAQIKFVQLTDPHLFESQQNETLENQGALAHAITKINELNEHNKYAFVVITGDIGIEQVVKSNVRIEEAAKTVAAILTSSDIKTWLFVPGNNDLVEEIPCTIRLYRAFIQALRESPKLSQFQIIDLCPETGRQPYISPTVEQYAFVGFNNASFKNNNDKSRVVFKPTTTCDPPADIRCAQEKEIKAISTLVKDTTASFVYIFYHIPEIDDPYLLEEEKDHPGDLRLPVIHRDRLLSRDITGLDYQNSSWFVSKDIRNQWYEVRGDPRVKGLFAGHLHDPNPSHYTDYPHANSEYSKIHICPPLAVKRQPNDKPQARGFCEISIDEDRAQPGGSFVRTIYWYDRPTYRFTASSPIQNLLAASAPTQTPSPTPSEGGNLMLENLAHLSTALQFIVVLISLAFIWRQLTKQEKQLKQQTDMARVANTQALVSLASPFNLELAKNDKMAELWASGGKANLIGPRKELYKNMLIWWLVFYENIFFQDKSKMLAEDISKCWKQDIKSFVEEHGIEEYWPNLKDKYVGEFAAYMDQLIAAKPSLSPPPNNSDSGQ